MSYRGSILGVIVGGVGLMPKAYFDTASYYDCALPCAVACNSCYSSGVGTIVVGKCVLVCG
ncbi:MAG: hypothetical protein K2F62_05600 [Muribaculaceae bacterium]|nr:hypothetical protein [Muribaculaceae bacterium]